MTAILVMIYDMQMANNKDIRSSDTLHPNKLCVVLYVY